MLQGKSQKRSKAEKNRAKNQDNKSRIITFLFCFKGDNLFLTNYGQKTYYFQ